MVSHAGVGMLREVADLTGLSGQVTAALADTYRGPWTHAPGDVFADLAAAVADGADCVDGVGQLWGDREHAFGPVASTTTLWRLVDERIDAARLPRSTASSPSRWPTRPCSRGPSSVAGSPSAVRHAHPRSPSPCRRNGSVTPCTSGSTARRRHNAFSTPARAALLEALEIALVDPSVTEVVLTGNGPSFCSGGDLSEFGSFDDPASAHVARTRHSPALVLDEITGRLGELCRAEVHGQVLGSGLEMAAFCGHVTCRAGATLGLPELSLGLVPGAGGTVSITRRIGRWRTAYLVLSGRFIDAAKALDWGLVDAVTL